MIHDHLILLFRMQDFLLCDGCTVGQFGNGACGAPRLVANTLVILLFRKQDPHAPHVAFPNPAELI
ncbi:hypothetical protein, partial [Mariniradius saccharolyticus]|uniref:hypothetical protein n=1 Tax=Mariniradius saccharolyticus TaxID=1245591 RepID=UPI001B7FA51A